MRIDRVADGNDVVAAVGQRKRSMSIACRARSTWLDVIVMPQANLVVPEVAMFKVFVAKVDLSEGVVVSDVVVSKVVVFQGRR